MLFQICKCKNINCCGKPRSDLFTVLPDRFFPPPCLIKHEKTTGSLVPEDLNNKSDDAFFAPLFQRLALNSLLPSNFSGYIKMPYDYFCPSVKSQIDSRICKTCGHYFATKKSNEAHIKITKHQPKKNVKTTKIVSIEAQRDKEFLCLVEEENTRSCDLEWIEKQDLNSNELQNLVIKENHDAAEFPVFQNVGDWIRNPWSTDNVTN